MPRMNDPLRSPLASQALLAAALTGLLGAGAAGCSDEGDHSPSGGTVMLARTDPDMTGEKFKAMCDEQGGALETHPHCGGVNSCQGFSYDESTDVYSEHTCKGLNTCNGYTCVLP